MATLPRVPTGNNQQYTLDAQASAGANSVTLNQSVAGVVRAPGYFVVDRIDSNGNKTPTKREYKMFTGVSGAQLTGVSNVDGTDQVHAVGAIVEFVPDVKYEQDWYDWAILEHGSTGVHASLASLALVRTQALISASQASLTGVNIAQFISASGASLQGFPVRPAWVFSTLSSASVGLGSPLPMPQPGTIEFVTVTLNGPVSGASLLIDVNKNFTSIFDAGTRPSILGGGTFVSTASIATKIFGQGNFFSVDQDTALNAGVKATVMFHAR